MRSNKIRVWLPISALVVATGLSGLALSESTDSPEVDTESGPVKGSTAKDVNTFEGIPYAAAPEGERRWEPPSDPQPWEETRDATKPGSPCPQPQDQPIAVPDGAEDCLNLNVTAPADADENDDLPVIMWLHGGSFVYGDGASYDAQRMADQGEAIVVTANYRLGALGFLSHPDMPESSNLGLADQRAALEWVRDNVSHFGGNDDNVTLMGQSAGGYSVCAQLTSPSARGLFDKAIIHSAGCAEPGNTTPRKEAEKSATKLAKKLNCDDAGDVAACLREKDAKDVLAAAEGGHDSYRPVHGTRGMESDPAEALKEGNFHRMPIMAGSNDDEEIGKIAGEAGQTGDVIEPDEYPGALKEAFGAKHKKVLREYPADKFDSPSRALAAALTDQKWSTPTHRLREAFAREDVDLYGFNVTEDNSPWFEGVPRPDYELGTDHMAELSYLYDMKLFEKRDAKQNKLATSMVDYWASFAAEGDPNHAAAPEWKPYQNGNVQGFASDDIGPVDFQAKHRVKFWESY